MVLSSSVHPSSSRHLLGQQVIVLQADNTILYDRLVARGYSQKKIEENVECEIMQVVAEEAADSYSKEVVQFLNSNSVEDMDANAGAIQKWLVADKQRKEQESASQG